MFVPNGKWTLSLKNDGKRSFSYETKASMSFVPTRRLSFWCQSWKGRDYYVNPSLSQLRKEVEFQKMVEREAFLTKPMIQCHLSQWREWVYGPQ